MDNLPAYYWMMSIGLLGSGLIAYAWSARKLNRAALLAVLEACFGAVCAFAGSVIAIVLIRLPIVFAQGLGRFLGSLDIQNVSFFGGVAGFILGVFLAARATGNPAAKTLNLFAPAGAFLLAVARFAEYFLMFLGVGNLAEETVLPFPLAVSFDFSGDGSFVEYYLAVFMFEGVAALAAMVFAFRRSEEKDCFLRTLFYICLAQVILESLRASSITWLFVRVEQLICFLYVEFILFFWYGMRRKGQKNRFLPAIIGLVVCGLIIAEEFALDKTEIPNLLIYACMLAGLVVLGIVEHRAHRRCIETAA